MLYPKTGEYKIGVIPPFPLRIKIVFFLLGQQYKKC